MLARFFLRRGTCGLATGRLASATITPSAALIARAAAAVRRVALLAATLAIFGGASTLAFSQESITRFPAKGVVPAGYPAQYAALIAAAEQEGRLVIHSTTDLA